MKGTVRNGPVEWFQFNDPNNPDGAWSVHVPFLMSNWNCLFGNGCPGHFGSQEERIAPDMGCCGHGAYITSKNELDMLQSRVDLLTEEDLDPVSLAYIRKHGWTVTFKDAPTDVNVDEYEDPQDALDAMDLINVKTKVRDGGCVFANRADQGTGKIGCAFVHLGNRLGTKDHIDTMPEVCWQLPLGRDSYYDEHLERTVFRIVPWDADYWGGVDEDGTHDSWMAWWCVDTPDAYNAPKMLYRTMERELRHMMGDTNYDILAAHLDSKARLSDVVIPMPGTVVNDGRNLLPVLTGNRTPRRVPKS